MSASDLPEVVVVGGGLAGLSCAIGVAQAGRGALVLERGDGCGSKSLSGGRLYLGPLRTIVPSLLDAAPFERTVTHESLTLLAPAASTRVSLTSDKLGSDEFRSVTVLRARLDAWLAERAVEAGAIVVPETRVDGLLRDGGRVRGVVAGDEEIEGRVVVAADGALCALGREARLRGPLEASGLAVGVKGVYALAAGIIEDRFCLEPGEGAADLFVGEIAPSLPAGAFLYTNRDSLSLGVVVRVDSLRAAEKVDASALLEHLEGRREIRRRLAGAELVEYGAHLVPELDPTALGPRVGDGIVLVGDAAGLVINHGITVRGMDLAIASGALAARSICEALDRDDTSAAGLGAYEKMIEGSFVGQDVVRWRRAARAVSSEWLMRDLPALAGTVAEDVYAFGAGRKELLSRTAVRHLRSKLLRRKVIGELLRLRWL